jgi:ATP-dependent Lhr-like helicase
MTQWLTLSPATRDLAHGPAAVQVLEALLRGGALFWGELVKRTGLLPSQIEEALGNLITEGLVTSDSFEGLRVLLLPQEKRAPFRPSDQPRRHKTVSSLEFAGRWSLLRPDWQVDVDHPKAPLTQPGPARDQAVETFALALLRRYGVVFRRLLDREPFRISWFELGRVYRRLEARGEIRGGYFVGGVSGEQFARPEAIGLLRSIRKAPTENELVVISAADPLNLAGIITPGPRVPAVAGNRLLLRDGVPVAALVSNEPTGLNTTGGELDPNLVRLLRVGSMAAALRPYYG